MPRYARRPPGQRRPPGPWLNGPVPVVGLIGGIGAGKSRLASALASRGATVLDADAIGHALLDQKPAREAVVERFGPEMLDASVPEGQPPRIDRSRLGRLVFADPGALRALEAILHPRMRKTFEKAILRVARRREAPLVVIDAAILLEAGWDDLCDSVVFVEAPAATRLARLSAARGWSAETLASREAAQWPLPRKRERADHVIVNDDAPEALDARVESLWRELTRRPASRPGVPPGRGGSPVRSDRPDGTRPSPRPRPSRPGSGRDDGPGGRGRRKR